MSKGELKKLLITSLVTLGFSFIGATLSSVAVAALKGDYREDSVIAFFIGGGTSLPAGAVAGVKAAAKIG